MVAVSGMRCQGCLVETLVCVREDGDDTSGYDGTL